MPKANTQVSANKNVQVRFYRSFFHNIKEITHKRIHTHCAALPVILYFIHICVYVYMSYVGVNLNCLQHF